MHVRPMRLSILCTPTESSEKKTNDVFYYVSVLFLYPNTILMQVGWTTTYSAVSTNHFKYL